MLKPIFGHLDTIDEVEALPSGGFAPPDLEHFGVEVTATIGATGGEGYDNFQFFVCSPSWLQQEFVDGNHLWLRRSLILKLWDYDLVIQIVKDLCANIEGSTWNEIAETIGRYMDWEYANYRV